MLNWFEMQPHITDKYIHWSDKNPRETAKALRETYDAFVTGSGSKQALDILLEIAFNAGKIDEQEANSNDL